MVACVKTWLPPGECRVQSGRIDERLENRSGWTLRKYTVELSGVVCAPSAKRSHFTGVRIKCNQSDLWPVPGRLPRFPSSRQQLVYKLHAVGDRLFGGALQAQVKRGIHASGVTWRPLVQFFGYFAASLVKKVLRLR